MTRHVLAFHLEVPYNPTNQQIAQLTKIFRDAFAEEQQIVSYFAYASEQEDYPEYDEDEYDDDMWGDYGQTDGIPPIDGEVQ